MKNHLKYFDKIIRYDAHSIFKHTTKVITKFNEQDKIDNLKLYCQKIYRKKISKILYQVKKKVITLKSKSRLENFLYLVKNDIGFVKDRIREFEENIDNYTSNLVFPQGNYLLVFSVIIEEIESFIFSVEHLEELYLEKNRFVHFDQVIFYYFAFFIDLVINDLEEDISSLRKKATEYFDDQHLNLMQLFENFFINEYDKRSKYYNKKTGDKYDVKILVKEIFDGLGYVYDIYTRQLEEEIKERYNVSIESENELLDKATNIMAHYKQLHENLLTYIVQDKLKAIGSNLTVKEIIDPDYVISDLKWNKTLNDLVELIYALSVSESVIKKDGSKASGKAIAHILEKVFNIRIANYYKTANKIKERKIENKFLLKLNKILVEDNNK